MNLNYGARGDEVKKLQTALNGAGYDSGQVDGIYGDITQGAVKRYQQANGLSATGQVDEGTYSKLFNVEQPTATTAAATQAQEPAQPTKQQQMADTYQQAYQPSAQVQQAQAYLQQQMDNKPGQYSSPYTQQVQDAYNRLMNRGNFSYDVNADALYNQYKDLYMQQGKQAMMDTMGQAAALTGGYGSSYASTAGNQAYQQWLTKLNEIVPELENRAYNRWQDEGDRIAQQYQMAGELEGRDYDRYRDTLSDWKNERAYAQDQYNTLYSQDYNRFGDERDYWTGRGDAEAEKAYSTATLMLKSGAMPSDALLRAAGIDPADARALYNALGYGNTGSGTGGSTYNPSGNNYNGDDNNKYNPTGNTEDKKLTPEEYNRALKQVNNDLKKQTGGNDQAMDVIIELETNAIAGKTYKDLSPQIQRYVDDMIRDQDTFNKQIDVVERLEHSGMITSSDAEYLLNKLGLY